jgi:hypothetical protein
MTIVNKVSFTNVAGGADVLDKIRTTAVSWGWTQFEWIPDVVFDAVNNVWATDVNGGYLALTSPGQGGSQDLIAKLHVEEMYDHPGEYAMGVGMCDSTAYDLTSTTFPAFQNAVTTTTSIPSRNVYAWSLPTANIPEIWIIGNSQYIYVVANLDGVFHTMLEFGSYEMRLASPLAQSGSITTATVVYTDNPWHHYVNSSPDGVGGLVGIPSVTHWAGGAPYWEGANIAQASIYRTPGYVGNLIDGAVGNITNNYTKLFNTGDNSGRRLMMRNTVLYIRPSDGLLVPVAETYGSVFNGFGLEPGQSLFYGTDEYIIFPCCSILSICWIAFRIA